MKCPNCYNQMEKREGKYKCEKCHRKFTEQELDRLQEAEYLDEHSDIIDMMEDNNGLGCNY